MCSFTVLFCNELHGMMMGLLLAVLDGPYWMPGVKSVLVACKTYALPTICTSTPTPDLLRSLEPTKSKPRTPPGVAPKQKTAHLVLSSSSAGFTCVIWSYPAILLDMSSPVLQSDDPHFLALCT